jgi:hypothetical protein
MHNETKPSNSRFVVNGADLGELKRRVRGKRNLRFELIDGDPQLVVVQASTRTPSPKRAWEQVSQALHADAMVAPVLTDADGNAMYPTGAIQVRFRTNPTDFQLDDFAHRHRLRIDGRNRYKPEQVVFSIAASPAETYLPDLIADLSDAPDVLRVWPVTKSKFLRT